MPNAFRRPQDRYGDSQPQETPYQRAAQVWDDRDGAKLVQTANWRRMAFLCAALACLTTGAYVYERQTTHVVTYVVPIDRYGRPGRIQLADKAYRPTRGEVGAAVASFVSLVRAQSTDGVVVRKSWQLARAMTLGQAGQTLMVYGQQIDPARRLGREAVSVEIVSVLERSPATFQVQWRETVYRDGVPLPPERWTGLFTTKLRPPTNEAEAFANPLGVRITQFQWSREL